MTGGEGAAARAHAIGLHGRVVDGNDVEAVDAAAAALVEEVRAGRGPRFLHAVTYRVKGHVSVDPAAYRNPDEVSRAVEEDPLRNAADEARGARRRARPTSSGSAAKRSARSRPPSPPRTRRRGPQAASAYGDIQDTGAGRWF